MAQHISVGGWPGILVWAGGLVYYVGVWPGILVWDVWPGILVWAGGLAY